MSEQLEVVNNSDKFIVGSREFNSRLLVGTGKYKDFKETKDAIEESRANCYCRY